MKLSIVLVFAMCSSLSVGASYKILALLPHPGLSHYLAFEPLFKSLVDKGHNLTMVSHFPLNGASGEYQFVNLTGSMPIWKELLLLDGNSIHLGAFQFQRWLNFHKKGIMTCNMTLNWPTMKSFKDTDDTFDVILYELFNTDCMLGLVDKLKAPSIALSSHILLPWSGGRFGVIEAPSAVPGAFTEFNNRMSFFQIIFNAYSLVMNKIFYEIGSVRPTEALLKEHSYRDDFKIEEVARNTSLILVNQHHALVGAKYIAPNVVEVGGINIKEVKPLKMDLEEFINEASNGVIYFSMGSMIKAASMSHEKLTAIQEAFAELPQKVMWKWENESMPGIPKNVMVRKWLPQLDILCHPSKNVKAFISHGGMLSTTEAAHCGVPMISIPLYGDQFANAAAAEESGLGTILQYRDIDKDTLLAALRKVLDPKMQQSAKKLSEIWRDRPQPPLQTAVYWIEHVARHGGAHLRPASADMPLYRYLLLDVLGFLALVGFIVSFISYKIFMYYVRLIFKSKSKSKSKPKPKKE